MPNTKVIKFTKPTKQVTIEKDSNLIADNIKAGVKIEGITGTYPIPQPKTINMDTVTYQFNEGIGGQVYQTSSGAPYASLTLVKDDNLIESNIVKGKTIEGVTGTYEVELSDNETIDMATIDWSN